MTAHGFYRNNRVWSDLDNLRMRLLYRNGLRWDQIAASMNVTKAAAVAHGHRIGLVTRPTSRPSKAAVAKPAPFSPLFQLEPLSRAARTSLLPLEAGHPLTWGLAVRGTLLDGSRWPGGRETAGAAQSR